MMTLMIYVCLMAITMIGLLFLNIFKNKNHDRIAAIIGFILLAVLSGYLVHIDNL
jgi:hypothetical protein